jgi:hypothetical protein
LKTKNGEEEDADREENNTDSGARRLDATGTDRN